MPYPEEMVAPMRQELTSIGVTELKSADDVDTFMAEKNGTTLVIVNSVCGCAAGAARPGVAMSFQNTKRPDRSATVFAGQDVEATNQARGFFAQVPPSSPSVALFKDGELVHFVPRHQIEGQPPVGVAQLLTAAYDEHCNAAAE
jgi:putative YphP/YqiW family bacilliredoxin